MDRLINFFSSASGLKAMALKFVLKYGYKILSSIPEYFEAQKELKDKLKMYNDSFKEEITEDEKREKDMRFLE